MSLLNDPEFKNLFIIYSIGLSIIFFFSLITYYISSKYTFNIKKNCSYFIFFSSLIFYVISILSLSFSKIEALHHHVDFATHLEILWRFSQGKGLTTLMSENYHGGSHWFAAHFTPIVYLTYAPIFKLFPYPQTIPVSETFFILSSLLPLWLLAKKYIDINLSRIFISPFLFYPTIFYTNLYGTTYLELCIPLFLWLFYFFEEKKNFCFLLILILTLMVREEISLVIIFFSIWMQVKKRFFLGLITLLLSLMYFYIAMFVIIPHFNESNSHLATSLFSSYGKSYSEIIINIFTHPLNLIKDIFILPKIGNFIMIFAPLLFYPFLNLPILFIAIPNLAITFLSKSITHSSYILYYLSPTIPILFYSIIKNFSQSKKINFIKKDSIIYSIFIGTFISTIFFGATPISLSYWFENYKVGKFYTTNFHKNAYIEEDKDKVVKKFIKFIPDNATVSAEQHLLPLLYKKKKMLIFPSNNEEIEYILIDRFNPKKTGGPTPNVLRNNPEFEYGKYLNNKKWIVIKENLGIILLKKKIDLER